MSAALDEAGQAAKAAVYSPDGAVAEIARLLADASNLARSIGRNDWSRKMEQLIRQVTGRPHSNSPVSLRPVGPVVSIEAWATAAMDAIQQFVEEMQKAHQEDPEGFPLERTAADWWSELSPRLSP